MSGAVAILRSVHERPGRERASIVRELGLPSGFAADTIARLVALKLVEERPAPPTGGRGRPTTTLHPHPLGPVVVVAAIAHERWTAGAATLGGRLEYVQSKAHDRDPQIVLAEVSAALRRARRRFGVRTRAAVISVPGTVSGLSLAQASGLGWHDVDLATLWPSTRGGVPLVAGNDASFAAIAEQRRGAAVGARLLLHLYMDSGIGGAVIEGGRVLAGSIGIAGEFGHMPFGDPTLRCPCGAFGCWGLALDGERLAVLLGDPPPRDVVSYSHRVLAAAALGAVRELAAAREIASALGRGAAGLVNAFDPDVVTIGGIGRELVGVAGPELLSSYLAGMMRFRPAPAPPIVAAHFGDDASVIGAVEEAFSLVVSDEGIREWALTLGT